MSSNVKVRGCCCGIPFGCGILMLPTLLALGSWPAALALGGIVAGSLAYGAGQVAREAYGPPGPSRLGD